MANAIIASKNERFTRLLLKAGIPVGPLFVGFSLILGLASSGFHFGKHEVSLLLVGSTGWLQMANFTLTGMLGTVSAVGLRRALHPGKAGTWGPILFGLYGISLIIAGCFHPDPQLGFPSGAPQGIPSSPSGHATIHSIVNNSFSCKEGLLLRSVSFSGCFIATDCLNFGDGSLFYTWSWAILVRFEVFCGYFLHTLTYLVCLCMASSW
jgi:hypothetical protein